jgi:hypothetical protein
MSSPEGGLDCDLSVPIKCHHVYTVRCELAKRGMFGRKVIEDPGVRQERGAVTGRVRGARYEVDASEAEPS